MGIFLIINKLISFFKNNNLEESRAPYLIYSENNIIAGRESYHNGNFKVKGHGTLHIGSYCAIGEDVKVILSNHNFNYVSMQYTFYRKNFDEFPYDLEKGKTVIGNDVWIGDNVLILPNINIGDGAILGGGAVVTKDIEPYTIVAGNPAKIIRKRFTEDKIEKSLKSEWWNWDENKIVENKDFFFKNFNDE